VSPFVAQSGRPDRAPQWSAFGTKQTSRSCRWMSAFGGKADIDWTSAQSCCFKSGWTRWNSNRVKTLYARELYSRYTSSHRATENSLPADEKVATPDLFTGGRCSLDARHEFADLPAPTIERAKAMEPLSIRMNACAMTLGRRGLSLDQAGDMPCGYSVLWRRRWKTRMRH